MIAAVTCFFNPMKQQLRLDNYHNFHRNIALEGIELYTAELAFNDDEFQLSKKDADHLLQIKSSGVMWQKERLLNIILESLPQNIDKIIWIDSDIIYPVSGWSKRISDKLEEHSLIQPYTWAVGLPKCELSNPHNGNWINYNCYGAGNIRKSFCYYACHRDTYPNLWGGHVGYVWAARRELLDKHKFYDVIITGAGDLFICYAAWGMFAALDRTPYLETLSQKACNHWFSWGLPFYLDVKKDGGPSYTEDIIIHLWHGDISNRNYLQYSECLSTCHFDPDSDLELGDDKCWRWKRKNYWLHDSVRNILSRSTVEKP